MRIWTATSSPTTSTIEDITEQTFSFGLEGPKAMTPPGSVACRPRIIASRMFRRESFWWRPFRPRARTESESTAPAAQGRSHGNDRGRRGQSPLRKEDAEAARIEHFVPRYGCDITEHTLPQETQQMHALHFQKGCYLGQEIVERIRSRGHVNRLLMGFRMESLAERLRRERSCCWRGRAPARLPHRQFPGARFLVWLTSECPARNQARWRKSEATLWSCLRRAYRASRRTDTGDPGSPVLPSLRKVPRRPEGRLQGRSPAPPVCIENAKMLQILKKEITSGPKPSFAAKRPANLSSHTSV